MFQHEVSCTSDVIMAYSLATSDAVAAAAAAAAAAGSVDISNTDDSDEYDWPSLIRSWSR